MVVIAGSELLAMQAANFASIAPGLVTIQGGTFQMGSVLGFPDERLLHQATISTFSIGSNTVTNDDYARHISALGANRFAVISKIPVNGNRRLLALGNDEGEVRDAVDKIRLSQFFSEAGNIAAIGAVGSFTDSSNVAMDSLTLIRVGDHLLRQGFDRPRQPVVGVSWNDAMVYALLHGCTLPTEWQWEYAARVVLGQEMLREHATLSGELNRDEAHYGWETTADVDDPRYPTLENGLRHMAGNVWEWIANYYGSYPAGSVMDPTGPLDGQCRGLRGGSWSTCDPRYLRAAYRNSYEPGYRFYDVGFRLVVPQIF